MNKKNLSCLLMMLSVAVWAQEDDEPQLVTAVPAKTEQVKPVTWLPANVISRFNADISAEQSGQLLFIADMGSVVQQGAVIAQLDDRNLKLQLSQLQAQQRQLKANVTYFEKQQQRMDELAKNYSTAVSEIDRNRRDLQVAKEQLSALAAEMDMLALNLEKTQIKAPFAGTVNAHFATLGELITVSMPLLQLVDTEHLDVQVATPLNLASFATQAKHAQVKWGDELVSLPIRTWGAAGNQASRTFDLRLDASGLSLFPGTAVQVSLPKSAPETAVMVPRDGLILRENNSFVFTVDDSNTAHRVSVQVGQGVAEWVVVSGQVNTGDRIVTRGGELLQDGDSVRMSSDVAEVDNSAVLEGLADAG